MSEGINRDHYILLGEQIYFFSPTRDIFVVALHCLFHILDEFILFFL